jgi:hypothetical protein
VRTFGAKQSSASTNTFRRPNWPDCTVSHATRAGTLAVMPALAEPGDAVFDA